MDTVSATDLDAHMSTNAKATDGQHSEAQVVLFLGAGASAFAGYHTFETFPDLLLNDGIRKDEGLAPMPPKVGGFLHEVSETLRVEQGRMVSGTILFPPAVPHGVSQSEYNGS